MNNMQFQELKISPETLRAVQEMGFEEMTPIQSRAIPAILEGKDIIGQAQTGTGKTCAFGIPAVEMIEKDNEAVQVLVLCPTRELAIQSAEEFKSVAKYQENVRILPVYGGQDIVRQIAALKKHPQIVIGTPGRIMDHMRRSTLKLGNVRLVVLDEADEMLSMGFLEDMDTILAKIPDGKQTVLFSATMPKSMLELAQKYQHNPEHIQVSHRELTVPAIEQFYMEVREPSRLDVLSRIIDGNNYNLSLVFCNTKKRVSELVFLLQARGYAADALHGDMRQSERDAVMGKFRSGELNILVATDVAARGIDVDDIEAVINYDIPNDEEYYVHRIGRTGRAGKTGKAYTFVSGKEIYKLKDIQRYAKVTIKPAIPPTMLDIQESKTTVLLQKVGDTLSDKRYDKFIPYIEKILVEYNTTQSGEPDLTPMDIAAALLKMLSKQTVITRPKTPAKAAPALDSPKPSPKENRYRPDRKPAPPSQRKNTRPNYWR
ncbi:MAG: DEAD/DEAH box helicase [Christensenellales bacterium]